MKIIDLFESAPRGFGFEDKRNARIASSALKKNNIPFTQSSAGGIEYFDFKDEKTAKAALKVVKPVIDKHLESEWGGPTMTKAVQAKVLKDFKE